MNRGRPRSPERLINYLQTLYARQSSWLMPLPWKPQYKFLYDQVCVKDIRFTQEICYDNIAVSKSSSPQLIGYDFVPNLLDGLHQLEMRLVTIEGRMGVGKSMLCQKALKEWMPTNGQLLDCYLYGNLSKNKILPMDMNGIMMLFGIPEYLYDDFIWLIENFEESIVILLDVDDMSYCTKNIYVLFSRIFPKSRFIIFCRPDNLNCYGESYQLQKALFQQRIRVCLHDFEIKQILSLVRTTSVNSIMFLSFHDSLHENRELSRLCTNPFICMVVISLYKDTKGMKFLENKLLFVRKIMVAVWKKHSRRKVDSSEPDVVRQIDNLLLTLSEVAIDNYTEGGYFTAKELRTCEHSVMLLESGLLRTHHNSSSGETFYSFFDPLLLEYTCALLFAKLTKDRPEERTSIAKLLTLPEWHNVCVLVASLLGTNFSLLLTAMEFDNIDETKLVLLANSLNQSKCAEQLLKSIKKFHIPTDLDFSSLFVTSSTLKGLQYIINWTSETNTDFVYKERPRSQIQTNYQKLALEKLFQTQNIKQLGKSRQKFNSCPDLNSSLNTQYNYLPDLSWKDYFQVHISKQCSLQNLRNTNDVTKSNKNQKNKPPVTCNPWENVDFTPSISSLSLCSSIDSLNIASKSSSLIRGLRLQGSTVGNRCFASLVSFVKTNQIERLYLMDQNNSYDQIYSNKIVSRFVEILKSLNEVSLNTNHLGNNWLTKLCEVIESDESNLKYISIAITRLEDLTVENALKLVKAARSNYILTCIELFCGRQPIATQVSLSFFADIIEKDDRLSLVFL